MKKFSILVVTILSLFLVTACTNEDKDTDTVPNIDLVTSLEDFELSKYALPIFLGDQCFDEYIDVNGDLADNCLNNFLYHDVYDTYYELDELLTEIFTELEYIYNYNFTNDTEFTYVNSDETDITAKVTQQDLVDTVVISSDISTVELVINHDSDNFEVNIKIVKNEIDIEDNLQDCTVVDEGDSYTYTEKDCDYYEYIDNQTIYIDITPSVLSVLYILESESTTEYYYENTYTENGIVVNTSSESYSSESSSYNVIIAELVNTGENSATFTFKGYGEGNSSFTDENDSSNSSTSNYYFSDEVYAVGNDSNTTFSYILDSQFENNIDENHEENYTGVEYFYDGNTRSMEYEIIDTIIYDINGEEEYTEFYEGYIFDLSGITGYSDLRLDSDNHYILLDDEGNEIDLSSSISDDFDFEKDNYDNLFLLMFINLESLPTDYTFDISDYFSSLSTILTPTDINNVITNNINTSKDATVNGILISDYTSVENALSNFGIN